VIIRRQTSFQKNEKEQKVYQYPSLAGLVEVDERCTAKQQHTVKRSNEVIVIAVLKAFERREIYRSSYYCFLMDECTI
jgi:hypothetical protein